MALLNTINRKETYIMKKEYILHDEEKKITIRTITNNDIELIRYWRNDESIRSCFVDSKIISSSQQQNWYEGYKNKKDDYMFIIELEQKPVGSIALYHITSTTAEYGRLMIGEKMALGKGVAQTASKLIIQFAEILGIECIYLEVFKSNIVAYNLYLKVGFKDIEHNDTLMYKMVYKF